MWTTQKHVPRWDLPAGLAGAQLGVKTPLPIMIHTLPALSYMINSSLQRPECRVKLLGEAAHLLTVHRGHVFSTFFVCSSTLMVFSWVTQTRHRTSRLFSSFSPAKYNIQLTCESWRHISKCRYIYIWQYKFNLDITDN